MATTNLPDYDEEQKKQQEQEQQVQLQTAAPGEGPTGSAITSAAGPQEAGAGGGRTTLGQFANLQRYIASNAPQATKLGATVAGEIGREAQEARTALGTAEEQFGQKVTGATQTYNPELISSAVANPTAFEQDPNQIKQLTTLQSGQYTGPGSFAEAGLQEPVTKEVSEAQKAIQATETPYGTRELIRNLPGTSGTMRSRGSLALDQLLLQNVEPAYQQVQGAVESAKPITEEQQAAQDRANAAVEAARTQAQDVAAQTREAFTGATGAIPEFQKSIEQRVEDARRAQLAQEEAVRQALAGGSDVNINVPAGTGTGAVKPANVQITETYDDGTVLGSDGRIYARRADVQRTAVPQDQFQVTQDWESGQTQIQRKGTDEFGGTSWQTLPGGTDQQGNRYEVGSDGKVYQIKEVSNYIDVGESPTAYRQRVAEASRAIGGQTPETALQALGITPEQWQTLMALQGQAKAVGGGEVLQNYLTVTPGEAIYTPQSVASPEDIARYQALTRLAGVQGSYLAPQQAQVYQRPFDFDIANVSQALQNQVAVAEGRRQAQTAQEQIIAQQTAAADAQKKAARQQTAVSAGAAVATIAAIAIICYAAGTKVVMLDGSLKNVEDLQLGDQTLLGGKVMIKAEGFATDLWEYNGVYVEGTHSVYCRDGVWRKVQDCDQATRIECDGMVRVYPIINEYHVMVIKGTENFISADFSEVDDPLWELNNEQRWEKLNADEKKKQFLDKCYRVLDGETSAQEAQ